MDISAEDFAQLFFDHWYCENRLPCEFVYDWDKLFVSRFWSVRADLSGWSWVECRYGQAASYRVKGPERWVNYYHLQR